MDFKEYLDLQQGTFVQYYRCLPISCLKKESFEEDGNRVIMPQSALDRLSSLQIEYPMQFQLSNPSTGRVSHCSVLEFVANEGLIYIQSWLMAHLGLVENDLVLVRVTSLPKATFVKLQPHTSDFFSISDQRDQMEYNFRKYACLTAGETISVAAGNSRYYLDVLEARPADAVLAIDTDCEVEFAQALDYKELPPPPPVPKSVQPARFIGAAMRMDGKPVEQPPQPPAPAANVGTAGKLPMKGLRFGGPSTTAAVEGGGTSKVKEDVGGKEQEKRFIGTGYSLQT
ncbi:hypothetical protein ACP4OV_022326 [Aristida adscensionis]